MAKTIVSLYAELSKARDAVQDLVRAGFSRDTISLVTRDVDKRYAAYFERPETQAGESPPDDEEAGAITGGIVGGLAGMLLGLGVVAIPGVGPALTAGPLATAVVGAGAGTITGSLVRAIVEWDVPAEEAEYYAERVRQGNTLICVTTTADQADRAASILKRYHPVEVS
jgi:hypothetical protein